MEIDKRYREFCDTLGWVHREYWDEMARIELSGLRGNELNLDILPDGVESLKIVSGRLNSIVSGKVIHPELLEITVGPCGLGKLELGEATPNLTTINITGNDLGIITLPRANLNWVTLSNNNLSLINMPRQKLMMRLLDVSNNNRLLTLPRLDTLVRVLNTENCANLRIAALQENIVL